MNVAPNVMVVWYSRGRAESTPSLLPRSAITRPRALTSAAGNLLLQRLDHGKSGGFRGRDGQNQQRSDLAASLIPSVPSPGGDTSSPGGGASVPPTSRP